MVYSIKGYNNARPAPRHDIDPRLKIEKNWHLDVANFIYAYHQGSWLQKRQQEFETLRRYAQGDQDRNQYKSVFIGEAASDSQQNVDPEKRNNGEFYNLAQHRMGFVNIDFDHIFSPAVNMMETIQGVISSNRTKLRVFAKDENSNSDRKAMEYKIKAQMVFKDLYDAFAAVLGGQQGEEVPVPSSMEELQMFISMGGFTLPYEIGMQTLMDYTLNHEGLSKEVEDQIIYDMASIGMSSIMDGVDEFLQRVKYEYVDPADVIIQSSGNERLFRNPLFWGVQQMKTIYEIRTETGWDERTIYNIAGLYNGDTNLCNPSINMDPIEKYTQEGECNYNDLRIPVLRYGHLTCDTKYYTDIKADEGEFTVDEPYRGGGKKLPRIHDKENRKTRKGDLRTWYTGYWIMNTNEVYNYGKMYDQPFDTEKKEPRCPLHFYLSPFPSIIKQCRTIFDDIQMLYLRYQNDKATAPPANGVAIDIGSLNDLKIGKHKLHPFDTIKIRFQTGTLLYSLHKAPIPGQTQQFNNVLPFQDLPGGIGKAVNDFVAGIGVAYQQLAVISGIDRVTMNSATPTGETTATQVSGGISATKDTLKHLKTGVVSLQESLCRSILINGQRLVVSNNDESVGYYGILNKGAILAIKEAGATPPAEYGLEVIAMPTEEEIARITDAASRATASGKNGIPAITASEYLFIVDALMCGRPLKYIIAYINYKEKFREEMDAKMAAQAQKANTEDAIMVAQEKAKAEKEKFTHETNENIRFEGMKSLFQIIVNSSKTAEEGEQKIKQLQLDLGFKLGQEINANNMNQQPGPEGENPFAAMVAQPPEQPQQP